MPSGALGVAYSQTITASGGTGPYTYAVIVGTLPTGLTLSAGGSLTGTPMVANTFNFTVEATDNLAFTGSRAYSITISNVSLDLTVSFAYINQSSQTQPFNVPLVKDRDGFLRAFVLANQANSATPSVRVRIYDASDVLLQTYTISAPGASVPTAINESSLSSTWNQLIPGSLLQPNYSILVDVDPTNGIAESNDSNNSWPSSGTPHDLDVKNLAALHMTLVPVTTGTGTGGVNVGNASSYMDYTRRIQPIPDYDVQVRASMTSGVTLLADGTNWDTALDDVTAQRTTDGSSRHYYGLVHVNYGSGVAGLGWIGYPVAIGWDYLPSASWVMAHEIGHNWSYGHTACNGEGGTDPGYPYANGAIGVYGYDLWAATQKDKTSNKDVMSYCSPQWISDYTYKKILTYRQSNPTFQAEQMQSFAPESCLLVRGLRRHGAISLEASFLVETTPAPPTAGPYRVEGVDAAGHVAWSQPFDLRAMSHPTDESSAGFCFAVPMTNALLDQIVALRVVRGGQEMARRQPAKGTQLFRLMPTSALITRAGGDIEITWDASAAPMLMVRDLERNECIGFARGGTTRISSSSGRLELRYSDGVHTRVELWP